VSGTRRIAFLVSEFPRPVDAYMLRELTALDARGVDLRIYSLRRPAHAAVPRAAEALRGRVVYAPRATAGSLWTPHAAFVRAQGRNYVAALRAAIAGHAGSPRLLAKVVGVWPQTVWFAERARRDGIGHVHANWATYPAAAAASIARLTGIPWSFAGHASDIYLDATNLAAKVRSAAFVTTCTEDNRRYLRGLVSDGDADRVHTVYHGIDLSAAARVTRTPGADLELLAVGTLRDCKGFDTLLQTVALLRGDGVPARLTVIGDGEDRPALERQAHGLGLGGHVTFTGYLPHEELAAHYARATLLVHPARSANHFGIPNVILEAQAARVPVVCTRLPALAELLEDGVSGIYVPEDDARVLAKTLTELFSDPARRERLAEAGFHRVTERFDIERTVERLLPLLVGREVAAPRREAVA
jgi:glycosyltransferase involved in cell wall biosynthesis